MEQLAKIALTVGIDHLQGSAANLQQAGAAAGNEARLAILERRLSGADSPAQSDGGYPQHHGVGYSRPTMAKSPFTTLTTR